MGTTKETKTLRVNLAFDKHEYKAKEKQHLVFTLTNESDTTLRVLKWDTPFDGFKSDMFHVEYSGKKAVYLGRVYKRGTPTEADYLTLEPGQSVEQQVDFTEAYDLPEADHYNVAFKQQHIQAGVEEPKSLMRRYLKKPATSPVAVKANTAIFKVTEKRQSKLVDGTEAALLKKTAGPSKKVPTFENCTAAQKTALTDALAKAVAYAQEGRTALSGAPTWARFTALRYKEWFGAYNKGRYTTVNSHYDAIWDALANKQIEFSNDADETAYAYVYPTKPYKIYLGKAFWTAPLTGTDSKAGTIVHETSHFNAVAGTDDHVYGQAGARNLAKSSPADATDNADSHEYFAENTPPLTMAAQPGSVFSIAANWKGLPAGFQGGFEAALNGGGKFSGKCYFFKGDQYVRYDWAKDKADAGYPKKIADFWHGLPAGFRDHFDTALNGQGPFAGKCYFFKGDSYIRYDWNADKMDPGYPKKIAGNWHNLPATFKGSFDASINGNGPFAGKCYFFKGDMYIRYDWNADKMDPGYPKKIEDYWHCLPNGYKGSFDAAVEGDKQFGRKGYFFKGNSYIRYNWEDDYAEV